MVKRIVVTVLDGNIGIENAIDREKVAVNFVDMLRCALESTYEGAEVTVNLQRNTSGSGPAPIVECDEGDDANAVAEFVKLAEDEVLEMAFDVLD